MMSYRDGRNGFGPMAPIAESFADLSEEVAIVLDSWTDNSYREVVDTTEFLDSSRVKRND